MEDLAPDITRQRLLIEGVYNLEVNEELIRKYFRTITKELDLRTYADPIIHFADGIGKETNFGYDAFVPLMDSGIYLGIWTTKKFLSMIIFTCKEFDVEKAVQVTKNFWKINKVATLSF